MHSTILCTLKYSVFFITTYSAFCNTLLYKKKMIPQYSTLYNTLYSAILCFIKKIDSTIFCILQYSALCNLCFLKCSALCLYTLYSEFRNKIFILQYSACYNTLHSAILLCILQYFVFCNILHSV